MISYHISLTQHFAVAKVLIAPCLTYCERLLFVTPDLLRKSAPEGLGTTLSIIPFSHLE